MSANVRIDRLTKIYDNDVVGVQDVTLELSMGIRRPTGELTGQGKALVPLADATTAVQIQCRGKEPAITR